MKAAQLNEANGPFEVVEIDAPAKAVGQARIEIHFAALNRRDLWIRKGIYPGTVFPAILGSDGSGVLVDDIPARNLSAGDAVVIYPSLNWGDDPRKQGPDFQILGMPSQGTLAEMVAVPEANVFPKPEALDMEQAAALPLAGLTAYRALYTRGGLKSGERVLVTGIGGGVSQFMLQFATATGAEVWVTSSDPAKIGQAKTSGAKGGVLYTDERWIKALQDAAGGFDLIVDSAAGPGFAGLPELVAPAGRIVFFGGTAGAVPELGLRPLFGKQVDLRGTMMGSPDDFESMLRFVSHHSIRPVIDNVYPINQVNAAFDVMEPATHTGKLVVYVRS